METDIDIFDEQPEEQDITQEEIDEAERHIEFIEGLRSMAEFFKANPDLIPSKYYPGARINVWAPDELDDEDDEDNGVSEQARTWMRDVARRAAPLSKDSTAYFFELIKKFGPHEVKFLAYRENVCEKRVVGTKIVEKEVYPEGITPILEEVEEEVVEWICPESLLRED